MRVALWSGQLHLARTLSELQGWEVDDNGRLAFVPLFAGVPLFDLSRVPLGKLEPVPRRASDGQVYTYQEFLEWYGEGLGEKRYDDALAVDSVGSSLAQFLTGSRRIESCRGEYRVLRCPLSGPHWAASSARSIVLLPGLRNMMLVAMRRDDLTPNSIAQFDEKLFQGDYSPS